MHMKILFLLCGPERTAFIPKTYKTLTVTAEDTYSGFILLIKTVQVHYKQRGQFTQRHIVSSNMQITRSVTSNIVLYMLHCLRNTATT